MGSDAGGGRGTETEVTDAESGSAEAETGAPDAESGSADAETPDPTITSGIFEDESTLGSAMAHLYRGEVERMVNWRQRLDRTTEWSVVVIAAVLTWAFSSETNPHYVLLVGVAVLGVFLGVEAHRYRGYDMWRSRVRTMQINGFAYALDPRAGVANPEWRERLSRSYRHPAMRITAEEALAHRLRRVYLPLALVVLAAWVVRITVFADRPWPASAAIGDVPGLVVTAGVGVVYLAALVVALRPRDWHTRGEMMERDIRDE